jgi:hypothetical protein
MAGFVIRSGSIGVRRPELSHRVEHSPENLVLLQEPLTPALDCTARARILRASILIAVALTAARSAPAHHSYAMFDPTKSVALHGTLKEFQWTNPHCFIQVLVDSDAGPADWSVQMDSPQTLYRKGWRPGTLKPGEKISVVIRPTKDGSHSGRYVSGIGPDGKALLED